MDWNIQNEGRAWTGDGARQRYEMTPEKIELIKGKLFWSDKDRITMLALLLENVGADQARAYQAGGFGLGLAIAQNIAQNHRARLQSLVN